MKFFSHLYYDLFFFIVDWLREWLRRNVLLASTLAVALALVLLTLNWRSHRTDHRILQAQELIIKGEQEKAASLLNELLLADLPQPVKEKIFFQLVDLQLLHLRKPELALKILDNTQLYELQGPDIDIKINHYRAQIYDVHLQNCQQAIPYYQQLINYLPQLAEIDYYQFSLAKCYKNLERWSEAITLFKKMSQDPHQPFQKKASLQLVLSYYLTRQQSLALEEVKRYQELETDLEQLIYANYLKANILEDLEQLEEAYKIYASLLYQYPNQELVKQRMNRIYERRLSRGR